MVFFSVLPDDGKSTMCFLRGRETDEMRPQEYFSGRSRECRDCGASRRGRDCGASRRGRDCGASLKRQKLRSIRRCGKFRKWRAASLVHDAADRGCVRRSARLSYRHFPVRHRNGAAVHWWHSVCSEVFSEGLI